MKKKLPAGYTYWDDLERTLLNNPSFVKEWEKIEPEYELARSLIAARLKKNLTQAELAKKIGSKQPVISRIESMTTTPSVSLLKRVAKALDAKLDIRFSF